MNKQRPPRDFDLPNVHLAKLGNKTSKVRHYIPPKTRDSAEVERLKSLPRGTLMAEHQLKGIAMSRSILGFLDNDSEGLRFATRWLAACGLNTAWYSFAADSEVMRRRLKLPKLDADDPEDRPSAFMLYRNILDTLDDAGQSAEGIRAYIGRDPVIEKRQAQFGRNIGHASLTMSCFAVGDFIGYESATLGDVELQLLARQRGLVSLEDARTLASVIGSAPSVAQLANTDSDLSVFWRREAPQSAYEALEFAATE